MRLRFGLTALHRFVCNRRHGSRLGAFAAITALAGSVLPGLPVAQAASPTAILPLEEVRKGQRGYGVSVFSGNEIERFEVEVLGVLQNLQPGLSYVLARLEGQNLEETGVIAGMSGSPVYVDGRLLGAVSFGWSFANEPIAGITPAASMRAIALAPRLGTTGLARPAGAGPGSEAVRLADLLPGTALGDAIGPAGLDGRHDEDFHAGTGDPEHLEQGHDETRMERLLRASLASLRAPVLGEAPAAVQMVMGGFGPAARELLGTELGAVTALGSLAGSEAAGGADENLVAAGEDLLAAGTAVAAVLVDGDLKLAATGTVTERSGAQVLAFGHPFLGLGAVEIPMAPAEIVTVVSNQVTSFKLANLGQVVGAVDFDHHTGIHGTIGRRAPTVPMQIAIGGEPRRDLSLSLARIPAVTPSLAAIGLLGALSSGTPSIALESLDLDVRFDLGEAGELALRQSFDGAGSGITAAVQMFTFVSYVLNNRLEDVSIEGIQVDLTPHPAPRLLALEEAHASSTVVRPGDRIQVYVDLAEYRGPRQRRVVGVDIPTDLAEGRYTLLVGDGLSTDAARLAFEPFEPVSFEQAVEFLNSLHSRSELRVLGIVAAPGLAVRGEVLPDLPGSIRSYWTASGARQARPLPVAVTQEITVPLDRPLEGLARIDLEVKRARPLVPSVRRSGPAPSQAAEAGDGGTETTSPPARPAGTEPPDGSKDQER